MAASLVTDLRRRRVFRTAGLYIVSAWVVLQVADLAFDAWSLPDAAMRTVWIVALAMFPVALLFGWRYDITAGRVVRTTAAGDAPPPGLQPIDYGILAALLALVVVSGYVVYERVSDTSTERVESPPDAKRAAIDPISIAVLPFDDMSINGDQAYMSDGVAEELLNLLARVPELRVVSRTSSFALKGTNTDIATAAEKLGADYILAGSVRTDGERLRIAAQLIDATTDTNVWSETYERRLARIFEVQDDIAGEVVDALRINLLGAAPTTRKIDPEAYMLALRARYFWNRRIEGDVDRAREHYERAVAIEPDYAPGWAGLSIIYATQPAADASERSANRARAQAAAERALRLDDTLPEAHVRMAQVYLREDSREAGMAALDRAVELGPNDPLALGAKAYYIAREGRIEEAIALYRRAIVSDPLSAVWQGNLSSKLMQIGRVDEAEVAIRKAIDLGGTHQVSALAHVHNLRGEFAEALQLLETEPETDYVVVNRAIALHGLGQLDASDAEVARLLQRPPERMPRVAINLARVYAARGEPDAAFEWLGKTPGLHAHDIDKSPVFAGLHGDPRWDALLAELRLAAH